MGKQILLTEYEHIETKESPNKLIERRLNQKDTILKLLKEQDFVETRELLHNGIYQYNARILELRRGHHDGVKYNIVAHQVLGTGGNVVNGFRLEEDWC